MYPSLSLPFASVSGIIADDGIVPYLVTLRVIHGGGPGLLSRRLISLHPGETTALGRLSKNHKTDFVAKSTNGYFDNPIISRCHALLENRDGLFVDACLTPADGARPIGASSPRE